MIRSIAVATGVAFLVAGVAVQTAQPGPPAVDPCTLVAPTDVETIIGKLKDKPRSEVNERTKWCSFTFANGADEMEIWVYPADGLERARKLRKDLIPVTDIGAEAYLRRNTDIDWIELYTKKGEVTVQVTMKKTAGDEDKVKALARKVVAKL